MRCSSRCSQLPAKRQLLLLQLQHLLLMLQLRVMAPLQQQLARRQLVVMLQQRSSQHLLHPPAHQQWMPQQQQHPQQQVMQCSRSQLLRVLQSLLLLQLGLLFYQWQACRHLELQGLHRQLLCPPLQQSPQARGWCCRWLRQQLLLSTIVSIGLSSSHQKQQPLQQLLQLHRQKLRQWPVGLLLRLWRQQRRKHGLQLA
jgi:hypothetical protein